MEAPEIPVNNQQAVHFLNNRLAELLAELIDKGNGELNVRIVAAKNRLQYVEFNPTEKHKLT